MSTKVTFCLTNCPLAPNSTTTTLPSHVVAKLKYKNTDEASRNTIIKKQIQHMKYRQQLVYGRKKVQSWQGLVASGPMEWGKGGKGWPEKATVRWSQLNVGGFFSWYESLHNSMWRRIHKVHFYNTSSFKTLHGFSSKAGWKWTLWQNCICKRPNKAGEAICILCIEVSKLSQARHKQQLPCNACGQRMGTVKLISTVTQFRGAQSIVCFGIQRRQSGVWQAKP